MRLYSGEMRLVDSGSEILVQSEVAGYRRKAAIQTKTPGAYTKVVLERHDIVALICMLQDAMAHTPAVQE